MENKNTIDGKVLLLNKQAMDFLHREEHEKCLKTLKETEKLLNEANCPKTSELWGITYNNFGCVYKKAGNFKAALFYLSKALEMEIKTSYDATNLASTHLNISAIFSSMSKHENSLTHALAALKTLQASNLRSMNYMVSVVIAYHSIGVENEHLRRYSEALAAYKLGWEIAEKELGPEHKLTETLRKSFNRGASVPVMPTVKSTRTAGKGLTSKRKSHQCTDLPLLSVKNSNRNSEKDRTSQLNKSSEGKVTRKRYYLHVRKSLSPISVNSSLKLATEMESINRLIKELDGNRSQVRPRVSSNLASAYVSNNGSFHGSDQRSSQTSNYVSNYETFNASFHDTRASFPDSQHKPRLGPKNSPGFSVGPDPVLKTSPKQVLKSNPRPNYKHFLPQIISIQRWWRRLKKRLSKPKSRLKKLTPSNVQPGKASQNLNVMRNPGRGKILRPIPETKYETKIDAVVKLQSWFRMLLDRRHFQRTRLSATTIQKHFRGFMTRRLYKLILSAVIFIQAVFRGHRVRKRRSRWFKGRVYKK